MSKKYQWQSKKMLEKEEEEHKKENIRQRS
jgi:hypothetical protein